MVEVKGKRASARASFDATMCRPFVQLHICGFA